MAISRIVSPEEARILTKKIGKIPIDKDLTIEDERDMALFYLNKKEKQAEINGCTLNGKKVETDEKTQIRLSQAANECRYDNTLVFDWKLSTGKFVNLTADDIIEMAIAVRNHIQLCMTREKELTEIILDSDTPLNVDIESGWPV